MAYEVARLISSPEVSSRLANRIGDELRVTTLSEPKRTYAVSGSQRDFIIRFACDESHLAALRKEARLQLGLRDRVAVLIPDTQVIDHLEKTPVFAIHRLNLGNR